MAIAIETLKNSVEIKSKNKKSEKPISDQSLWDNLKQKLLEELNAFPVDDNNNFEIIKNKIENLNNPTNAQTLLAPFENFNIDLNDDEKQMIKKRNQLLHGVSNHKTLQEYNIEFDIAQMYKENLIYYHLIYYLILKIIGYDGAIMNIRALDYVQKITKEDISRSYIILT